MPRDTWMDKDMVHTHTHIYTIEYYSAIKKIKSYHWWQHGMDLEGTVLSEISWKEKDKYCMISLICVIKKKHKTQNKWTNQTKHKQTRSYREQSSDDQSGWGGVDSKMSKRGQLYGDRWKQKFWWWAPCWVYRSRNTMLYTWNVSNVINQCYPNKK